MSEPCEVYKLPATTEQLFLAIYVIEIATDLTFTITQGQM